MITFSFSKTENGIFIAHTDILRCINRVFRRAGIQVAYSQGFNKHMLLRLSQPLPFGIASEEEWASAEIENEISAEEVVSRFNQNAPPYLWAKKGYCLLKNPNIGGLVTASSYLIRGDFLSRKAEIEQLKSACVVEHEKRNVRTVRDVTSLIYRLAVTEEGVDCLFAFGNENLRIDSFINLLNQRFSFDISITDAVRTGQYVSGENGHIPVDAYLEGLL